MTILLMEAGVDTVLAYLQASLDARVTAIAADYPANPIDMLPVAQWGISEQPPGLLVPPFVAVVGEQTEGVMDAPGFFESYNPLTVYVVDMDQDSDRLRRRLYRWIRALFLVLRDAQETAALNPYQVNWGEPIASYGAVLTAPDRSQFWQDAALRCGVRLAEAD